MARSGAKPDVKVLLDPATPLEFDGDLEFVEELRKIIPPDLFGDGPSLDLSPTGIRAGFSFALPPVAVGVFALKDVSLGAALTLPFLDGKPTFDFNVSERPHPFLLSVGIFGGGGFFHLQLDTAGLKLVEAAFEFGATASIDLGVASGGVHIMAGIYFKLERKEPRHDLAPTLIGLPAHGRLPERARPHQGLARVQRSASPTTARTDKAYGRATLTVKVEIVFFSTSVEITVEKAFGGSSGDPSFGNCSRLPRRGANTRWRSRRETHHGSYAYRAVHRHTARASASTARTLPVSVFVSPRLVGADTLGEFPDWLNWTQTLKEGLTLTFRSGTHTAR